MSYAQELGCRAGKRNVPMTRCPYIANLTLRARWFAGHAEGLASRVSKKYPRARNVRRTRWSKSQYVRQRLTGAQS